MSLQSVQGHHFLDWCQLYLSSLQGFHAIYSDADSTNHVISRLQLRWTHSLGLLTTLTDKRREQRQRRSNFTYLCDSGRLAYYSPQPQSKTRVAFSGTALRRYCWFPPSSVFVLFTVPLFCPVRLSLPWQDIARMKSVSARPLKSWIAPYFCEFWIEREFLFNK